MLSNRPYLLRAFHQWIVDSACTPILVLDAKNPRCKIPQDYVESGEIVFNISATAVRNLQITNELIEFKASFSGVIHMISAPITAVLAVYAEENGEGLFLDAEEDDGTTHILKQQSVRPVVEESAPIANIPPVEKSKPILTLVE